MHVVPVWRWRFAVEQKTIFLGDGFDEGVEYFLDFVDCMAHQNGDEKRKEGILELKMSMRELKLTLALSARALVYFFQQCQSMV